MKKILFVITAVAMTVFIVRAVSADKMFPRREGKIFSARDVKGRYVFSFQGEVVGAAIIMAATGVLIADGEGNVTDGVRMISVNGVPSTQTFTCSIVVHPNGTGSAICPSNDPAPGFPPIETFSFVLQDNGKGFRFIGTTLNMVVQGTGERQ